MSQEVPEIKGEGVVEIEITKFIQQLAKDSKFPLYLNQPIPRDEFTVGYENETGIYHLSLRNSVSILRSFELLTYTSAEVIKFASKFQDTLTDTLDFPIHVLPSLETSLITNSQQNSIYFRHPIPRGVNQDVTLFQHLSNGRWVSEKILLRWTIQILRTLKSAHEKFLVFPEFSSQDIHLLSDEVILSSYRLQIEAKRQRSKREEEEMKILRKQARLGFGVTSSSSFNSQTNTGTDEMKLPDLVGSTKQSQSQLPLKSLISSNKSQGLSSPARSSSVFSNGSSSTTSQSQNQNSTANLVLIDPPAPGKLAPRKDAWLLLPFDGLTAVDINSYSLGLSSSSFNNNSNSNKGDGLDDDLSETSALSEDSLKGYQQEKLPTLSNNSNRRQTSTDSNQAFPLDLDQNESQSPSCWLRKYQINRREKEITENTMFQLVSLTFSETTPVEIADQCRSLFSSFIQSVQKDLKSLGSIIIESYLRRPLTTNERKLVNSPSFGVDDLMTFNSFDRLSKGMTQLLHLCYTPLNEKIFNETILSNEDSHRSHQPPKRHILRANLLKMEEDILIHLEKEFHDFGGIGCRIGHKDMVTDETFWTKEVQEMEEQKRMDRLAELERKAKIGKKQAHRRNISRRKQLLFDMLPEEEQELIIKKKNFRKLAIAHKKERNKLVFKALFHRWGTIKITQWIKESFLNCLKKNYYLKKSGIRLSLEQKHEWDRTVRPIERAIGKILIFHPYQPPVVKIEGAQAILLQLKEKKSLEFSHDQDHHKQKILTKDETNPSKPIQKDRQEVDDSSNPSSPNQSRPTTADHSKEKSMGLDENDEPDEPIVELDEMTSHEKEIRYLHCFEYACHTLASLLVNEAGVTVSVFEDTDLKASLTVAKQSQRAVENASTILEKSAVASNLPPDQFREKMLVVATKELGSWDAIHLTTNSFAQTLGIKDRQWFSQITSFIAFSLVSRYDSEERIRKKGEAIAASRIQGFARGYITRKKIREIWRLADEQFEREEIRRLEKEKEVAEMNRIVSKSKLKKTGIDENEKIKTFTDEDATWVSLASSCFNSTTMEIFLSFQKNSTLPKDDTRRSLQIKCVARLLQQPDVIPDPESTNYIPPSSNPKEGLIEIVVDDLKRILKLRQDWVREGCSLVDCSIRWEELTERHKRISASGLEDEAASYLQIGNLIPHRRYRFKVMVNMRYRPTPPRGGADQGKNPKNKFHHGQDDPEEIRLSRAGYLTIQTEPDSPHSPTFLETDVIHYDHKIPQEKSSSLSVDIPSQIPRTVEEEIEYLLEDRGLSVVDKLKKYNEMVTSKKSTHHSGSTKVINQTNKSMKQIDMKPPVDHHTGLTERRVSCRLHWTIPYSNGNSIVEYQIQKLVDNSWHNLTTTKATNYTDTLPAINPITNQMNKTATYRIRASNEYGWSPYSDSFDVNLIDKICDKLNSSTSLSSSSLSSSSKPSQMSYSSYQMRQHSALLPHGISLSTTASQNDYFNSRPKSPSRLLTSSERDSLIYSNMYSLPPSVFSSEESSLSSFAPPPIIESHQQHQHQHQDQHIHRKTHQQTQSTSLKQSHAEGKLNLLDYGKNPTRHKDSPLSGETLIDVNKSIEQWLCRLADTCPIDETTNTNTATAAINTNSDPLTQQDEDEEFNQHPTPQLTGTSTSMSRSTSRTTPANTSVTIQPAEKKKIKKGKKSLLKSSTGVLESIYETSGLTEKHTPTITAGNSSTTSNVIQQLVVTNHNLKYLKQSTQPIVNKSLPNYLFCTK